MKERIYVCHTFYQVYTTLLKELALPKEEQGKASLLLSKMSIDFTELQKRLEETHYFEELIPFDEKREDTYPELDKYRTDKGNIVFNMISRIIFTKKFGKRVGTQLPVDLRQYKEIYVYCDSDPIGYYLNYKRIKYHAIEDGLNCLVNFDAARYDNRGAFSMKAFMSKKLNLIFVQNGWGKYCMDMEVNDIAKIPNPCPYYKEVPRKPLVDRLTKEDKDLMLRVFVQDKEALEQKLRECRGCDRTIMILTEPLCDMETRKQIFTDLIEEYSKEGTVFLKPHPRDYLDYRKEFPDVLQFDGTVPMEMLNFFPDIHFDKVIGVLTELRGINYADETIRLGPDFMDKYENPEIHRQNEMIHK